MSPGTSEPTLKPTTHKPTNKPLKTERPPPEENNKTDKEKFHGRSMEQYFNEQGFYDKTFTQEDYIILEEETRRYMNEEGNNVKVNDEYDRDFIYM
eukprot:UN23548